MLILRIPAGLKTVNRDVEILGVSVQGIPIMVLSEHSLITLGSRRRHC
ncbi:MAG: hypothetical protein ACI84R_002501 [Candidatus Azotimanducaceae bacterium]|jgi:hypothetical protein